MILKNLMIEDMMTNKWSVSDNSICIIMITGERVCKTNDSFCTKLKLYPIQYHIKIPTTCV